MATYLVVGGDPHGQSGSFLTIAAEMVAGTGVEPATPAL